MFLTYSVQYFIKKNIVLRIKYQAYKNKLAKQNQNILFRGENFRGFFVTVVIVLRLAL